MEVMISLRIDTIAGLFGETEWFGTGYLCHNILEDLSKQIKMQR
jgi:hypothetical protein